MRTLVFVLASGCLFFQSTAFALDYPSCRKADTVDVYHGREIKDPYRWLEDADTPESKAWIAAENKLTGSVLSSSPSREWFKDKLTKLWNYDKYGVPFRRGQRLFFTKQTGLANQPVLYASKTGNLADGLELVDPNKVNKEGTTSFAGFIPSDDGSKLAYGLSEAGSDWAVWQVKNLESGGAATDTLKWIKFSSPVFTKDGKGLYYSRYPESANGLKDTNYYNKLYYHKLGTDQSADLLIAENKQEKEWMYHPEVSEDGRYLVVSVSKNTNRENLVYFKDLEKDGPLLPLVDKWGAEYSFIDNEGDTFLFATTSDAPRSRIVSVDVAKPGRQWKEVVGQSEDTLRYAVRGKSNLVCHYIKDAHADLKLFDLKGAPAGSISLPGVGACLGISARKEDKDVFYAFTGFTKPRTIYSFDLESGKNMIVAKPEVAFNPEEFETRQVFYESTGGARIPMFLVWRKGNEPERGNLPVHLYAYGGFSIPMLPAFSPAVVAWTERGGVYAHACLRGGGEYGEDWHKSGMLEKKQNVFDDFVNGAKYLQEKKITAPALLSVSGASNGGLLIGAVLTQHPELYGACAPEVGVLDMLRFHKFTIGHAWTGEYGSSDDAGQFNYLIEYSPLHNIVAGRRYPATMVLTGDHDDRVFPAHSFKFAAMLQACQAKDGPPVLIRIETQAGHGQGKPTGKIISESADKWCFLWDQTAGASQASAGVSAAAGKSTAGD